MRFITLVALLLLACDHSDPYFVAPIVPTSEPLLRGQDIRLTFNPEQDYTPTWTQDGRGILYTYARQGRKDNDRCIGILPPSGGTRIWNLCDDRGSQDDSANAIPAAAVDSAGQLLYVEAIGRTDRDVPETRELWLADTATPFNRRSIVRFPTHVGDSIIDWMGQLSWQGKDHFSALGQRLDIFPHCLFCTRRDSVFTGLLVVTGEIGPTGATLHPVAGTANASSFSFAENGSTVVFVRSWGLTIEAVPAGGGAPRIIATLPSGPERHILGITCRANECLVARGRIDMNIPPPNVQPPATAELYLVTIPDGVVRFVRFSGLGLLYYQPQISPLNGDIAVQVNGQFGPDIYVFKGLLP